MHSLPPWYQGLLITFAGAQEAVCNAAWNIKARMFPEQDPPCLANARGKHVLITGGSSGIGLATAVKLVQHGASVTVTSRSTDRAHTAAEQIKTASGKGGGQQVRSVF